MIEKYPLYWPEGKPRTEIKKNSRFETSFGRARDGILLELSRMNAGEVIISSNIPLRKDGLPYSNSSQPFDTGVAVYFTYKKKQHCFACDLYRNPTDNMQAIMKTIQALRGIARWGTGDMMEQAFRGFEALASGKKPWWEILGSGTVSIR